MVLTRRFFIGGLASAFALGPRRIFSAAPGAFAGGKPALSCPAARGGDASRDAMRRTGRDDVSSPDAAHRIMVATQSALTPTAFVVARQRQYLSRVVLPTRVR